MAKHTDPITKRLSENIVHARKIYGLSQVRMATLIGVDPDTIRNWEACRRKPDHHHIVDLANALQVGQDPDRWTWFYDQHEPVSRDQPQRLRLVADTGAALSAQEEMAALFADIRRQCAAAGLDVGALLTAGQVAPDFSKISGQAVRSHQASRRCRQPRAS